MDVVNLDNDGAILTIEALIAAILLITAISFLFLSSIPSQYNQYDQYSEIQLREYGKTILFSTTHKVLKRGDIDYQLNREYSPRPLNTSLTAENKWNFDSIHSDNITTIKYNNQNWTDSHLTIDYEDKIWEDNPDNESLNIQYLTKHYPTDKFIYPKDNGKLHLMKPFPLETKNYTHIFNNTNTITVNEEGKEIEGDGYEYSVSLIWYESRDGGVSNPSVVWVDKKPEDHDEVLTFDINASDGEINKTWKLAEIIRGEQVIVTKNSEKVSGGQFYIIGSNGTKIGPTKGKEFPEHGINVEKLENDKYRFTFTKPAKGAYSIHWGNGWGSDKRWDPLFVMVGKPNLVGEVSYIQALAFADISLDEFKNILKSHVPDNVGFNFYVYSKNGSIYKNRLGQPLMIYNGVPLDNSVSIERQVFLKNEVNEGKFDDCTVRMELWYR